MIAVKTIQLILYFRGLSDLEPQEKVADELRMSLVDGWSIFDKTVVSNDSVGLILFILKKEM